MKKKQGFTLVELLAVIVILAIILAIAIPGISGIIKNSTKAAFESDAKMILQAIEYKKLENSNFDPLSITKANMAGQIGIGDVNYESITISINDGDVSIVLVGTNKWDGLTAYGTRKNMNVVSSDEYNVSTPESCFTFATGTITDYLYNGTTCPSDVIIPSEISGIAVTDIGSEAFSGYDLTSVIIPNGIINIDGDAFSYNNLTSVTIPNSVTYVGTTAFQHNDITEGNAKIDNVSGALTIDSFAFSNNGANGITNISPTYLR